MRLYVNKLFAIATLALTVISGAAFADTRGDYINNPDAYGVVSVDKGTANGRDISFDIPVHASLLGQKQGAMPVSAHGRMYATSIAAATASIGRLPSNAALQGYKVYATSIGYYTAHPVMGSSNILGLAHSPYQR